jgi:hypothetical protein
MQTPRSSTTTLIDAMLVLVRDIQSSNGVANAAIYEAARRLQEQQDLLRQCQPYISAQHGAEHMLDGFKPKPRPDIDQLLRRVNQAVDAS